MDTLDVVFKFASKHYATCCFSTLQKPLNSLMHWLPRMMLRRSNTFICIQLPAFPKTKFPSQALQREMQSFIPYTYFLNAAFTEETDDTLEELLCTQCRIKHSSGCLKRGRSTPCISVCTARCALFQKILKYLLNRHFFLERWELYSSWNTQRRLLSIHVRMCVCALFIKGIQYAFVIFYRNPEETMTSSYTENEERERVSTRLFVNFQTKHSNVWIAITSVFFTKSILRLGRVRFIMWR